MTTISAKLDDSLGSPLTGYIRITLSYDLTATDNSVHTRVPAIVPLVAGQATFDLEPSENSHITYYFEYFNSAVTPAVRIKDFYAVVPDLTTTVNIGDLEPTGITQDAMDTSLSAITRRLYTNDLFWDRFQDNIMSLKGTYNSSTWYKRGDFVYCQGGSFIYINRLSSAGNVPVLGTTTAYWTPVAAPGQPGSGTTGSLNLYDAVNWNGNSTAVSQNSVRDLVENVLAKKSTVNGLAPLTNAVLTTPSLAASPVLTDRSTAISSTEWTQALLDIVRRQLVPVGTVTSFAGSSAPQYWIFCDGRAVSRSTYAALFTVLGTLYGAGNGSTTFNLPDLRGRTVVGLDNLSAIMGAANRVSGLNTVGQTGGAATRQLTTNELPAHTHGVSDPGHAHQVNALIAGNGVASGNGLAQTTIASGINTTGITIQSAGSGNAFSIMNPYQGLCPIIFTGV